MFTSLRLRDFKNFGDETLRLGPFTMLVGANASGKSNVRDAFRFLHGIGRGYDLADVIGGRYGAGGQVEWVPIRGGVDEIVRFGRDEFRLEVGLRVSTRFPITLPAILPGRGASSDGWDVRYEVGVGRESDGGAAFHLNGELLRVGTWGDPIFTSRPGPEDPIERESVGAETMAFRMAKTGGQRRLGSRVRVPRSSTALVQVQSSKGVAKDHKDRAVVVQHRLSWIRFLDPSPERMRQPSFPGQTVLDDRGGNLPTVLRDLCEDAGRRETLIEWTRELTPMDVADFEFPVDPTTGRIQLAVRENNGAIVSAYAASDGTLRFLAMLAALLGKNPAGLYVFEEIDNGIHPSRLRLLIDLIESQTAKGAVQVLTTTHSPELLSMVSDQTFKSTSLICRRPESNTAVIRSLRELPDAERLRASQGLGRLHGSGWMEDAVFLAAGDPPVEAPSAGR